MKKTLYSLLISSFCFAGVDTGTGSDGACSWSGAIPSQTYNCTTLTTTGATTITGTNPLIIKVQGDVNINFSLALNGQNGAAGGLGIAGGYNGGTSATNGSGPSAGTFGNAGGSVPGDLDNDGGGGGAGGAHASLGSIGSVGITAVDHFGAAGIAPTSTYGNTTLFNSSMSGGAGGGGGGNDGNNTPGGEGGGGGGVLRISAGGDINISAVISANGGNGNNASNDSGGGGGGAGGAIFLASESHINITATISAIGGSAGNGAGNGGNGGSGGNGLIRFDDSDGVVVGSGFATPTASVFQVDVASQNASEFVSDISPGCAIREISNDNFIGFITLLISFILINLLDFKKRIKA